MDYHAFAHELLTAKERITCIHAEDFVNEQPGITILYNEGTSYFRPVESRDVRQRVWKELLALRPNHLVQLGNVLFSPENVTRAELFRDQNDVRTIILSFKNHREDNKSFSENDYEDLPEAYRELTALLSRHQEYRAMESPCFLKNTTKH